MSNKSQQWKQYKVIKAQEYRDKQKRLERSMEQFNERHYSGCLTILKYYSSIIDQDLTYIMQKLVQDYEGYKKSLTKKGNKKDGKNKRDYIRHNQEEKDSGEYSELLKQKNKESALKSRNNKRQNMQNLKNFHKQFEEIKQSILDLNQQLQVCFQEKQYEACDLNITIQDSTEDINSYNNNNFNINQKQQNNNIINQYQSNFKQGNLLFQYQQKEQLQQYDSGIYQDNNDWDKQYSATTIQNQNVVECQDEENTSGKYDSQTVSSTVNLFENIMYEFSQEDQQDFKTELECLKQQNTNIKLDIDINEVQSNYSSSFNNSSSSSINDFYSLQKYDLEKSKFYQLDFNSSNQVKQIDQSINFNNRIQQLLL